MIFRRFKAMWTSSDRNWWTIPSTPRTKTIQKMIDQIDKYGDKLFAEPIEVDTPSGNVFI